jgi:hypothetical protein
MRAHYLLTILLMASVALAQSPRDKKAISFAKSILVSQLDPKLPGISFERWLQKEAGEGASIQWEVNDCGEQTGSAADRGRDFPMCVEATAHMADKRIIVVNIAIGTFKKGIRGKPGTTWISVGNDPYSNSPLKSLSDVPLRLIETPRMPPQPPHSG